MPRPRWDKLESDRQQTILDAASEEFAEKGFDQASFNRIIETAGLSKGAVYYYFDDKEDLFQTVVKRIMRTFREALGGFGPVSSANEFWTEFEAFMARGARFKVEHPNLIRLGIGHSRSSLSSRILYQEFMVHMEDIFRQGQAVGAVRTDLPADLLTGMIFGMIDAIQLWMLHHLELGEDKVPAFDFDLGMSFGIGLYRRILTPGDEPPIAEVFETRIRNGKEETR